MNCRGDMFALRGLLWAAALTSVCSTQSSAAGIGGGGGGGGPSNLAATAAFVAAGLQSQMGGGNNSFPHYFAPPPPPGPSSWESPDEGGPGEQQSAGNNGGSSGGSSGGSNGGSNGGQNQNQNQNNQLTDSVAALWRAIGIPEWLINQQLYPLSCGVAQCSPPGTQQGHLGMYVSGDASNPADSGVAGSGSVVRGSGYRISDSAGALAPGTTGPSFRDTSGNGGIWGSYDASRFFGLGGNQSLVLRGFFDYQSDSTNLGAAPAAAPLVVGNAGSLHGDTYTFGGVADYRSGLSYLRGTAQYSFGHTSESSSLNGGSGSFGTSGYGIDARLGQVFVLFGSNGAPPSGAMPTKAPPRAAVSSNMVGLDLSAHVGYVENRNDAFTDTADFTFGTGRTEFGDVGGRAELFDQLPRYGLMWKAYIAGTVDQHFSYSSSMNIPIQAAVPSGDLVTAQAAKTFGGAELGLSARGPGGWTIGVQGFYQASADTTFAGGSAYLRIPFYSARY
jgi:hypothetical protein